MKLLLSYIFFFLSFGCLLIVCNTEKWNLECVLLWACMCSVSIYNVDRNIRKERNVNKITNTKTKSL